MNSHLPIFFAQPYFLLLLFPLLFFAFWQWKNDTRELLLRLPQSGQLQRLASAKMKWAKWADLLLWLAFSASIIALSRPQMPDREAIMRSKAIDIIIVLDVSLSMLGQDFKPNRMAVAKEIAADFIKKRPFDRIGLVAFSGEALTKCPLTGDHNALLASLELLQNGDLEQGTAVGMALATATNRIKESKAKSKVVILMTDGVDDGNAYIQPIAAAELAKTNDVRVYTIGIGTNGLAPMPVFDEFGITTSVSMEQVFIDEATLTRVADISNGGRYFRARDDKELSTIYDEIDRLEKTDVDFKTIKERAELYFPFLLLGIICLSLYFILNYTVFRGIGAE